MPQRRNGQHKVVKILCDWAGTTPEIVALYVFGSRARGTARPDSDLDLAVEVSGGSFGPLVKFVLSRVRWIEELRTMTGIPVKDLELIEVSKSVKDPVEYIDGMTCQFDYRPDAKGIDQNKLRTPSRWAYSDGPDVLSCIHSYMCETETRTRYLI